MKEQFTAEELKDGIRALALLGQSLNNALTANREPMQIVMQADLYDACVANGIPVSGYVRVPKGHLWDIHYPAKPYNRAS